MLLLQISTLSPLSVEGQTRLRPAQTSQDTAAAIAPQDTATVRAPQGDIATTINYSARDSILFEVGRRVVHLYGDAKIDYGTMKLEAAYIEINYETNTLTATTLTDSTGKEVGTPVFAEGAETYAAKRIAYNYKTKRGRISDVVTQQGEGYIHAEVVKKNELNEVFGLHARYTTCNLEHPHFFINAGRIKAIPNDKVMSGPFNLVIGDIPTPLGFLFGLFPTPRNKRSSGIIMPTFGETRAQGFFLRNGGYYFAVNDYIGTSITGDIYSLGGYNVSIDNTYRNRYSYSGNLRLDYRVFRNDEADVARSRSLNDVRGQLPPSSKTFWIYWTHSPVQKPGRGRFTASVNAGSALHQRLQFNNTAQYLSPTFNSTVTYQKNIQNTPFSYTAKLSQGQTSSGIMNFVLPDLNFSMTPIGIYEIFSNAPATGKWYENFIFGYNVNARNEISNQRPARTLQGIPIVGETRADTIPINFNNLGALWENGRRSATHNFTIGLGNYKIFRFFNLSPNVNYSEAWTDRRFTYRFDPDSQRVVVDTANFGRVYEYSAGASLNTQVYGTVYVRGKRLEAIRHVIRPSVSYFYRPDFGNEDRFGFYQTFLAGINPETNQPLYRTLSRFGQNVQVPGRGLQSALQFSLQNNIEMKVRSKSDTSSTAFEKVSLIDNLGITTAYNFAADSFNLSVINVNMNTRLFKVFNINANSTFDPYQVNGEGQRINRYMLQGEGFKLARLTNASVSVTASFNPASSQSPTAPPQNLPSLNDRDINPMLPSYIDFKIPWTFNVNYTVFYSPATTATAGFNLNQNLGVDGSLNLTEKWKVTYQTSYDFVNNNIAHANINIYRDLHCWEMSIGWVPFGFAQGYNVTINAKSSLLQDLRLTRRRGGGWNY